MSDRFWLFNQTLNWAIMWEREKAEDMLVFLHQIQPPPMTPFSNSSSFSPKRLLSWNTWCCLTIWKDTVSEFIWYLRNKNFLDQTNLIHFLDLQQSRVEPGPQSLVWRTVTSLPCSPNIHFSCHVSYDAFDQLSLLSSKFFIKKNGRPIFTVVFVLCCKSDIVQKFLT